MQDEERLRSMIVDELDNLDWDMSDEGLDKIAHKLQRNFRSLDEARDFVDSQASYLVDKIDEFYS